MKGNLFLGTGRGKIGDIVMYRMNGRQMARPRIREVANPRSEAQNLQRMVLATVTGNASYLRALISHSFEGVQAGVKSYNYFNKVNIPIVRNSALSDVATCFRIKGAKTFVPTNGMLLGSGSLGVYGTGLAEGGASIGTQLLINDGPNDDGQLSATFSNSQEYYNYLSTVWGCAPGDEVCLCFAVMGSRVVAEFESARNKECRLIVGRLVWAEWTDALVGVSVMVGATEGGGLMFNPAITQALFNWSTGGDGLPRTSRELVEYGRFIADSDVTGLRAWLSIATPGSSYLMVGGAAFLSRYDYARGQWLNSVSTFFSNEASAEAEDVAPSYGNASASARESDYYLEQSESVATPDVPTLAYATGISTSYTGPFVVQLENVPREQIFTLFFKLSENLLSPERIGIAVLQYQTTGSGTVVCRQEGPAAFDDVYPFQVSFSDTPLAGDFVEIAIIVNDITKTFSFEF